MSYGPIEPTNGGTANAGPPNLSSHEGPPPQRASRQGQSGLGIASFVLSILSFVSGFALIGTAGVLAVKAGGTLDEKSAAAVGIGLGLFAVIFIALASLGLGIAGVAQKTRGRTFAVLGLVFSGVAMLGLLGVVALGLASS